MNDTLDLRNRILKMRESNNFTINKEDSLNNNLMSKFESSIKDDNEKKSSSNKEIVDQEIKEADAKSIKNNFEIITKKNGFENKNRKKIPRDNEAQFLMLANKFNEAVEVILELSEKVEKLERIARKNLNKREGHVNSSSFFSFKIFVFLLLIPIIIISFFTLPFDFTLIKSIIIDILSVL